MKSKVLRVLLGILGVIAAVLIVWRVLAKDAKDVPFYATLPQRTRVIAHMGGDNVWPGDTLFAYEQSVKLGVDAFDMDAHITKDGVIVLMHDEKVDRTTDGTGVVEEMTLAEIKKLDAAYKWSLDGGQTFPYRGQGITVPTLEEVFQAFPEMHYLIELKLTTNPISKPFCELVHQYNMQEKVIVASFHDDAMADFRKTCPDVATSAARNEVTLFVLLSKVGLSGLISPPYQSLQVPFETSESKGITIMTPAFIKAAHAKNLSVEVWTLNDPELFRTYMSWGLDGVDTDRPDLMMQVIKP